MKLVYDPEDPIFQKRQLGPHPMPGLWSYFLPKEFVKFDLPKERCSTCMDCPKVREEGWRKDYRCCTYHPRVANFALGLSMFTKEGEMAAQKCLKLGVLTPEGMTHSPLQYIDYLQDLEEEKFGQSERVLCPMLDQATGFCNIHAFRNSVCSTFFCLNDHGDVGEKFWSSVQTLVGQVEIALSQWCLEELGYDVKGYARRLSSLAKNIKNVSDPKSHGFTAKALKTIWGDLYGKELETYKKCAELVSENRDYLWEIACDTKIFDAEDFDQAILKNVPKSLQHQIDEEEWETGCEASLPQDLWRELRKNYYKLWQLPTHPVTLNRKIEILENKAASASDIVYKKQPFKLHMRERRGSKEDDFVLYLSKNESEILETFREPRTIDWRFLAGDLAKAHPDVKSFLMEASAKKILVRKRG